jgi:hypothetical protein
MSHETWGMINMFLRVGSPVRRDVSWPAALFAGMLGDL